MTKPLTAQEKKEKKAIRKQQKAASTTSTHVIQPKHEEPPPDPVNLCDTCAYEFGECEGRPKFASDQDETLPGGMAADRVTACEAYLTVGSMPTAEEQRKAATETGVATEEPPLGEGPDAAPAGGDEGSAEAEEEETEESGEPEELYVPTPGPARPDPKRFHEDETDYGNCPSCARLLKRTAYNRYLDAIRCTNPRCRAYRAVVKTVSTGVK